MSEQYYRQLIDLQAAEINRLAAALVTALSDKKAPDAKIEDAKEYLAKTDLMLRAIDTAEEAQLATTISNTLGIDQTTLLDAAGKLLASIAPVCPAPPPESHE